MHKQLILMKFINLSIFLPVFLISCVRNHRQSKVLKTNRMFPSKGFIILAFIHRALIHFELFFIYCEIRNFFLNLDIQLFQNYLLKEYSFFLKWPCHLCTKSTDHRCVGLFLKYKIYSINHCLSPVGFPGGSVVKESTCKCRLGFDLWVGKVPWRKK